MSAVERERIPEPATGLSRERPADQARTLGRIGAVLGVGVAGTLDEVLFHQLLQWHNFYVHTTERWRIVIDGLFHLFTAAMLFAGALLLWRWRTRIASLGDARALLAGTLMGAGGFNLYDGTVQHKLLQLHPVREGVANILPYDLAWNLAALALLVAGWWLWATRPPREQS
jgi:uncharacterized membrane protein